MSQTKKWFRIACHCAILLFLVAVAISFQHHTITYRIRHPYDKVYYTETVSGQLVIRKNYSRPAPIDITVNDIFISTDRSDIPFLCSGKITLTLTAKKDMSFHLVVFSQQSPDNIGGGGGQAITLEKDVPKTVTIGFGGWKGGGYYLTIYPQNLENRKDYTIIRVYIGPLPMQ